jgi:putative acetyltransferase
LIGGEKYGLDRKKESNNIIREKKLIGWKEESLNMQIQCISDCEFWEPYRLSTVSCRNTMIEIKHCSKNSEFSFAMQITKDYISWLNMDLAFQDIDRELSNFPSMYGPPKGLFLLAWRGGELVGGTGLRMLTPEICEMKRLFVYDQFKSKGVGRSLCIALIREAKNLGYQKMRLDNLGCMNAAIRLYESLGFEEIEPYRFNPDPTTKYMELSL